MEEEVEPDIFRIMGRGSSICDFVRTFLCKASNAAHRRYVPKGTW